MRTYCSLVICSENDSQINLTIEKTLGLVSSDVVDTQNADLVARRKRFAELSKSNVITPARFFWRLTSNGAIDSSNVDAHLSWFFNQIPDGRSIKDITKFDCHAVFKCFWAGAGRGGGPIISLNSMQKLIDHGVQVEYDFYVESEYI